MWKVRLTSMTPPAKQENKLLLICRTAAKNRLKMMQAVMVLLVKICGYSLFRNLFGIRWQFTRSSFID